MERPSGIMGECMSKLPPFDGFSSGTDRPAIPGIPAITEEADVEHMSKLPPFGGFSSRGDTPAIPAIPAIDKEPNSDSSGNSRGTHQKVDQAELAETEVVSERATSLQPPYQEDLSHLYSTYNGPNIPKPEDLLPWASELSERELVLKTRVSFVETPLRTITTERVSFYAALYLKTIAMARSNQDPDLCWGIYTPEWWKQQEQQALDALSGLRSALEQRDKDIV